MNLKGLSGLGGIIGILGILLCAVTGALKLAGYSVFLDHRAMTWFVLGIAFIQVAVLIKMDASCSSTQKS